MRHKRLWIIVLLVAVTANAFAGGGIDPKKAARALRTATRKDLVLRSRISYELAQDALDRLQIRLDNQTNKILASKVADQVKISKLELLNDNTTALLAGITEITVQKYNDWGTALLKQRDERFLPPASTLKLVPPLFDETKRPEALAKFSISTPKFFREWVSMLESSEYVPAEVSALITTLSVKLTAADVAVNQEIKRQMNLNDSWKAEKLTTQDYLSGISRSQKRLAKISQQAARNVTDVVHLCNLYPTIYGDDLVLLAHKIDGMTLKTPFALFIRQRLDIPEPTKIRGFRSTEESSFEPATFAPMERQQIGFRTNFSREAEKPDAFEE